MSEDYDYLFKCVIVGDGGSGKTAIVVRFSQGFFQESYKLTIGVEFAVKSLPVTTKVGEQLNVKLQIWDTGGQERFQYVRPLYYKGAMGSIVLFDVTNRESFDHISKWISEVRDNAGDVPMLLVGNKVDLTDARVVTQEEALQLADDLDMFYVESSAKTGIGVGDIFEVLALLMIGEEIPEQILNNKEKSMESAEISSSEPEPSMPKPEPISSKPTPIESKLEPTFTPRSVSPEPIKSEPTFTPRPVSPEPIKSEPTFTPRPVSPEPIKSEPTFTPRPVSPEPIKSEPIKSEPTFTPRPVSPEPIKSEPTFTPRPVSPEPIKSEPTFTPRPVSPEPIKSEPTFTPRPVSPEPVKADISPQFINSSEDSNVKESNSAVVPKQHSDFVADEDSFAPSVPKRRIEPKTDSFSSDPFSSESQPASKTTQTDSNSAVVPKQHSDFVADEDSFAPSVPKRRIVPKTDSFSLESQPAPETTQTDSNSAVVPKQHSDFVADENSFAPAVPKKKIETDNSNPFLEHKKPAFIEGVSSVKKEEEQKINFDDFPGNAAKNFDNNFQQSSNLPFSSDEKIKKTKKKSHSRFSSFLNALKSSPKEEPKEEKSSFGFMSNFGMKKKATDTSSGAMFGFSNSQGSNNSSSSSKSQFSSPSSSSAPSSNSQTKTCPNCSAVLNSKFKFCNKCGTPLK